MANTTPNKRRWHALRALAGSAALSLLVLAAAVTTVVAGDPAAPHPGKHDKCPVCGMFVYRYPDFVASVGYADGQTVFFDGAKDMFKYLFNRSRYAPDRAAEDPVTIIVTEYYDMQPIDAHSAVFVAGSDVLGPMGQELIPFRSLKDAELFVEDHAGRLILPFVQVTPAVIRQLD
jgi:copper chaperone NosL